MATILSSKSNYKVYLKAKNLNINSFFCQKFQGRALEQRLTQNVFGATELFKGSKFDKYGE